MRAPNARQSEKFLSTKKRSNLIRICVAADSNEDWQTDDWNVPVIIINLLHRPTSVVISLQFDLAASSPIPFAIAPAIVYRTASRCIFPTVFHFERVGRRPSRPPSESLPHLIRLFQSSIIQFTRCEIHLVTPCIHTLPYARYVPISMSIPSRISISI